MWSCFLFLSDIHLEVYMGRLVPAVTPRAPQPGQLESLLSALPDTWECRRAAKREQPAKPAQELSQKNRWQTVLTLTWHRRSLGCPQARSHEGCGQCLGRTRHGWEDEEGRRRCSSQVCNLVKDVSILMTDHFYFTREVLGALIMLDTVRRVSVHEAVGRPDVSCPFLAGEKLCNFLLASFFTIYENRLKVQGFRN